MGGAVSNDDKHEAADVIVITAAQFQLMKSALELIARGLVPLEQHGHYLAHRRCVKLAREALSSAKPADRA